jgi:hypothetical protein
MPLSEEVGEFTNLFEQIGRIVATLGIPTD